MAQSVEKLNAGITDTSIMKNDTIQCPISQFDFTEADIKNKYGGDTNFLLTGVVTHVTETTISIKFEGDMFRHTLLKASDSMLPAVSTRRTLVRSMARCW